MHNVTNIMPLIAARQIAENPRKHFEDLAHSLRDQKLLFVLTGHAAIAARIEDAAKKAERLSRAQRLDPDRLRALAEDCRWLVAECAAQQAQLSDEENAQ